MHRIMAAGLIALALAACSTAPIVLRHPQTGQRAQCGPYYAGGIYGFINKDREARCLDDYQRQGYERVPQ